MPATHTRLIKFSSPGPTDDQFSVVEQQLTAQSEAGGDKVLDIVWTEGDFDVVSTIEAKGSMPAPLVAAQLVPASGMQLQVKVTTDLAHRPLARARPLSA